MTRHREATDDETFEDFLWEVDVTRRRAPAEHPAPLPTRPAAPVSAPAPTPAATPTPAPQAYRSTQPRPGTYHPRLRFSRHLLAQLAGAVLLVGGTAALVLIAVTR
ncbi:hypothetical protein [Herbiconiux sp.]|uniref:hypothetical protein n=1 Tax=Herbiconiux sp. TaxID=1871186 RepID=UPI0025C4053E|nr:hypothetical protein [Herbiconiux sp.]